MEVTTLRLVIRPMDLEVQGKESLTKVPRENALRVMKVPRENAIIRVRNNSLASSASASLFFA